MSKPFFELTPIILNILGKQESSVLTGFTYGFISSFNHNFFKNPISQMFGGTMMGFICTFGADLLVNMLPLKIRPIVPLALGLSTIYHIYDTIISCPDDID